MAYCVPGVTSRFIATFAAGQGVKLTKLVVNTDYMFNFARTFESGKQLIYWELYKVY